MDFNAFNNVFYKIGQSIDSVKEETHKFQENVKKELNKSKNLMTNLWNTAAQTNNVYQLQNGPQQLPFFSPHVPPPLPVPPPQGRTNWNNGRMKNEKANSSPKQKDKQNNVPKPAIPAGRQGNYPPNQKIQGINKKKNKKNRKKVENDKLVSESTESTLQIQDRKSVV